MYRICSLVPVFGASAQAERVGFSEKAIEHQTREAVHRPLTTPRRHPLLPVPVPEEHSFEPKRDLLELFFLSNRG